MLLFLLHLHFLCAVCSSGLVKAPLKRSRSTADGADEDSQEQLQEQLLESGGPEEEQRTDNTSLLRLLEEGEKVREPHPHTHQTGQLTKWEWKSYFICCIQDSQRLLTRISVCSQPDLGGNMLNCFKYCF